MKEKVGKQTIQAIEDLLRAGKLNQARERLRAVANGKFERADLAQIANLARRAGLAELTLLLLSPIVRPEIVLNEPAAPKEIAIYAAALADLGAVIEATSLLKPLKDSLVPEVVLYRGFVAIYTWDYAQALSAFKKYLTLDGPSEYQKTIARLNVAAAYRFLEQDDQVITLLAEILEAANANGWTRLSMNALDLAVQSAIFRGDWQEAERCLEKAGHLAAATDLDTFLLKKWQAVLELQRNGPSDHSMALVNEVHKAARVRGDWETLRDLDHYWAVNKQDPSLFVHVLFGTPHESFRRRLVRKAKGWLIIPKSVKWTPGASADQAMTTSVNEIDLDKGCSSDGRLDLGREKMLLRLLRALASDFYKPLKLGQLFALLYPNEHFDPVHSPERVRMLARRLGRALTESGAPLSISHRQREFHLVATGAVHLRVRLKYPDFGDAAVVEAVSSLKSQWPYKAFSSAEAAQVLQTSPVNALKLLNRAFDERRLHRSGIGRATRFRFAK